MEDRHGLSLGSAPVQDTTRSQFDTQFGGCGYACSQMEAPPLKPTLVNELSGDRMDVGDVFTIGRSSDCDLVIERGRVSRKHAMIRREGDGFVFYDLQSANGSWVDDRHVDQPVPLHERSHIRIESREMPSAAMVEPANENCIFMLP
ncbi:MAG: FHA domain-containing protein, partial [Roseibacillus sp.]